MPTTPPKRTPVPMPVRQTRPESVQRRVLSPRYDCINGAQRIGVATMTSRSTAKKVTMREVNENRFAYLSETKSTNRLGQL